jgi:serine/threonine protein kinase
MINKKYVIKRKLGEGRSTVYLCEDISFRGKELALKVLPPNVNSEEANLFREEYFILTKLNHPGIIKARETGVIVTTESCPYEISKGSLYIAMEYFPGVSLEKFSVKNEEELLSVVTQLASVLYYLHQSNYIYYDLKPENILVSSDDGLPVVKLIDLGLARHTYETAGVYVRGTKEYIAPELLSSNDHDHRVDLYSLGMLIYKLIYNKLPFNSANEMEIFKSHIEGDFEFPETQYSERLVNVVKKLLSGNPSGRYFTILEVLHELGISTDAFKKDWVPAKTFTGRKDVLSIINTFINRQSDGEVLSIRGTEGAGKSSLLEEIYYRYNRVVYLNRQGPEPLWKTLLQQIIYSDFIYNEIENDVIVSVQELIDNGASDLAEALKAVMFKISRDQQFIILLDEYNKLDEFNLELFRQLIPLFQVNNIKLILTEDSSYPYLTASVNNLIVVNLTPFTEANLIEYIDKSFSVFFPKQDTKKIVMLYADLLPGSINTFLHDLVLLDILEFHKNIPVITFNTGKLNVLGSSQGIISHQVNLLAEEELYAAEILSLFEIPVNESLISVILKKDQAETEKILKALHEKNIISPAGINSTIEFTSGAMKKYIYSGISGKRKYHLEIAEIILSRVHNYNRPELARHFEIAGVYNRAIKLLKDEASDAEKISAFLYRKKIIQRILEFHLDKKSRTEIKYELGITLFRLGDKKSSLDIIGELLSEKLSRKKEEELTILKGKCLISTGSPAEGIEVLSSILASVRKEAVKEEIMADIAAAEFDLSNYTRVTEICTKITGSRYASNEIKAKSYNLMGLVELYSRNSSNAAIKYLSNALEYYREAGLPVNISGIELNLGNIFFMKRDHDEAEIHWERARGINQSIGNLDWDAKLLLNYGNYYFDREDFEKAIENYKGASSIFASLGDKYSVGVVLVNLGESFITICSYQDAFESLRNAKKIFAGLKNYEEEAEAIFMLARLYYIIGAGSGLAEMITEYKFLSEQKLNNLKHSKNLELLQQMELISIGRYDTAVSSLTELKEFYFETENRNVYSAAVFLLCDVLLHLGLYEDCRNVLEDNNLLTISNQYNMVNAYRLYYLGNLAEQADLPGMKPPKEYYEESYSLIENQSITWLTLEVLYAKMKLYAGRGVMNKAMEILVYIKAIIEFITESIKDNNLRTAFFSRPERKIMLEYISQFEAG